MNSTLVLGVGNILLSDEGAGVHAMRYLEEHYADLPATSCLDAGTLSFTLAAEIGAADNLLVFDAAQLGREPGALELFEGDAFDDFLKSGRRSVHEVGFADLMDVARLQDALPVHRALIGIQPAVLGWGEYPGAAVAAALPRAAGLAASIIRGWTVRSSPADAPRAVAS